MNATSSWAVSPSGWKCWSSLDHLPETHDVSSSHSNPVPSHVYHVHITYTSSPVWRPVSLIRAVTYQAQYECSSRVKFKTRPGLQCSLMHADLHWPCAMDGSGLEKCAYAWRLIKVLGIISYHNSLITSLLSKNTPLKMKFKG